MLEVFKEDKVMLQGKMNDNLYRLVGDVLTNRAIVKHGASNTVGG